MATRMLKVGIMPFDGMKARTIALAQGKYRPRPDEPKVWFVSLRSLASVLSEDNQALLQVIRERQPASLSELEKLTGPKASNLSRTLRTLERYGIVRLKEARGRGEAGSRGGRSPLKPEILASGIDLRMSF